LRAVTRRRLAAEPLDGGGRHRGGRPLGLRAGARLRDLGQAGKPGECIGLQNGLDRQGTVRGGLRGACRPMSDVNGPNHRGSTPRHQAAHANQSG